MKKATQKDSYQKATQKSLEEAITQSKEKKGRKNTHSLLRKAHVISTKDNHNVHSNVQKTT